jgi:predicted transcriptional regulator
MADAISISGDEGNRREDDAAAAIGGLGRREREVLAVLYELESASVQDVCARLSAELAYTTVMTTLDRLYRKGLLRREKQGRAFIYRTALSAKDMEGRRAAELVRRFFAESEAQREVLVSCLVDAVHGYDAELLDRLEATIREARAQGEPDANEQDEGRQHEIEHDGEGR